MDVERGFSRGRLTVSRLRHSLSDQSTRSATVLGNWGKLLGLVPEDEIVENFKNKHKRAAKAVVQPTLTELEEVSQA